VGVQPVGHQLELSVRGNEGDGPVILKPNTEATPRSIVTRTLNFSKKRRKTTLRLPSIHKNGRGSGTTTQQDRDQIFPLEGTVSIHQPSFTLQLL